MSSELRVFISSTFQDMQEERGYLMKHIFPEIRQRCRERGIEFTEIDLRWGLTHEEGTLGRIIRTCFEEIDKCRPFFIGILGSRYGWVPRYLDIQKDPDLLRKYPWIEQEVLDGASLLDLEFSHGVLRDSTGMDCAFFYVREANADEHRSDEADRIVTLTERIRTSSRPLHTYDSLQQLGERVRADMLAAIDTRWPDDTRNTRAAAERRGHEAFAAARRHAYIANPENLKRLNVHAASDDQPLMIVAESGMGKSALLAFWSHAYRTKHPGAFVITHFIGTTPQGGAHGDVLRRILVEIKDRTGWSDEIPTGTRELEDALPLWLARLQEPLVLVIDALNQLDDRARSLTWLPQFFPSHVRVILSATPGAERDAAQARGWGALELRPLTREEREVLAVRFLGEYRKGLSTEQVARIGGDEKCESPLFLRTVLEELRLFGYFQELDEHIDHYLASPDLPTLFQNVLERIEADFGETTVRDILTFVWASRRGLSENEIMAIAGLNRAECSRMLLSLDYHLMQREGLRTFFHEYLRKAVEARYLSDEETRVVAHRRLGEYFSSLPVSDRRAEEEPWQWERAGEWERLRGWVSDLPARMPMMQGEERWELMRYLNVLESRINFDAAMRAGLRKITSTALPDEIIEALKVVGNFATEAGVYPVARELLSQAVALAEERWGMEDVRTARVLSDHGTILRTIGEFDNAQQIIRQAVEILEKELGATHPDTLQARDALGTLLYQMRNTEEAETLYRSIMSDLGAAYGPLEYDSTQYCRNLAAVLYERGEFAEAETLLRSSLSEMQRTLGDGHFEVANVMNNLAAVLKERGDAVESLRLASSALAICERVLGPRHPMTLRCLVSVGALLNSSGDFTRAQNYFLRAFEAKKQLFGSESLELVSTLQNLGVLYIEMGDASRAELCLEQALAIVVNSYGPEHTEAALPLLALGRVCRLKGDLGLAGEYYRRGLALRDQSHGDRDPLLRRHLENYLSILEELGQTSSADFVRRRIDSLQPS